MAKREQEDGCFDQELTKAHGNEGPPRGPGAPIGASNDCRSEHDRESDGTVYARSPPVMALATTYATAIANASVSAFMSVTRTRFPHRPPERLFRMADLLFSSYRVERGEAGGFPGARAERRRAKALRYLTQPSG